MFGCLPDAGTQYRRRSERLTLKRWICQIGLLPRLQRSFALWRKSGMDGTTIANRVESWRVSADIGNLKRK